MQEMRWRAAMGGAEAVAGEGIAINQRLRHVRDNSVKVPGVQTALRLIYPARCTICGEQVESDFALCGPCWRDTPLISGLCCDLCGVPLPGEDSGEALHCDECMRVARPWARGRAAMLYRDNGRKLVLALKYYDRQEVLRPCVQWLAGALRPILPEGEVLIAPVPLHWMRFLKRTYNQSALLAQALGKFLDQPVCPDLLIRSKRTQSLAGLTHDSRFRELDRAIRVHPKRMQLLDGRPVLLIDDVMTSGATLAASAQACHAAGAGEVFVGVLARAAKDA